VIFAYAFCFAASCLLTLSVCRCVVVLHVIFYAMTGSIKP